MASLQEMSDADLTALRKWLSDLSFQQIDDPWRQIEDDAPTFVSEFAHMIARKPEEVNPWDDHEFVVRQLQAVDDEIGRRTAEYAQLLPQGEVFSGAAADTQVEPPADTWTHLADPPPSEPADTWTHLADPPPSEPVDTWTHLADPPSSPPEAPPHGAGIEDDVSEVMGEEPTEVTAEDPGEEPPEVPDDSQESEDSEESPGPSRRKILVGLGAVLVVAVVAIIIASVSGGSSKPSSSASKPASSGQAAAAPAAGGAPAGRETIAWGNTFRVLGATPGPGCQTSQLYTFTITNGARYAGQTAIVVLYGPDYPDKPRQSVTVGPAGTFDVPYQGKVCFAPGSATGGVALVSVAGNTNVQPSLSSIPGAGL